MVFDYHANLVYYNELVTNYLQELNACQSPDEVTKFTKRNDTIPEEIVRVQGLIGDHLKSDRYDGPEELISQFKENRKLFDEHRKKRMVMAEIINRLIRS